MDNYNYPLGADNSDAPWNQQDSEIIETSIPMDYLAECGYDKSFFDCVRTEEAYRRELRLILKEDIQNHEGIKEVEIDGFEINSNAVLVDYKIIEP